MDLSFILNELGEDRSEYFNAVVPPIIQTSNFAFKKVDELGDSFKNEYGDYYLYSRGLNPTVDILRKKLAALDGAEDALVFNSGASAIYASVLAHIKSGDHVVSVRKPYTWAQRMFDNVLPRFGVSTSYIDGRKIENFEHAIQPNTTVIYLESPNSWDYQLQDLGAVATLARSKNIITICDNSYCTPLYQRPIEFGIDLSLQSATKYIGGHSDVLAGVLCGSKKLLKPIFDNELQNMGNGISPFNAWLLLRGLRTLPIRMEKISSNTLPIVQYLKQHPLVEEVIFTGDPSFPQYELAKKQMSGACGLVTIVFKASRRQQIVQFCEALQHILMAVSWGGYESLLIPKCAAFSDAHFNAGNREHKMIRFYFGLEDPEYLITDLNQAFEKVSL